MLDRTPADAIRLRRGIDWLKRNSASRPAVSLAIAHARSGSMTRARSRTVLIAALLVGIGLTLVVQSLAAPASSTAGPQASTSNVIEPVVDSMPWSTVDWQVVDRAFAAPGPVPHRIDGLTQGSNVLVGWGRVSAKGRNQFNDMGAVFVSTAGEEWRSIALDDGVRAGDTSEPHGVSVGPRGLLAWGGVCCGIEEKAIWTSDDGHRWTRAEIVGDLAVPGAVIVRVVGLPTGWVAVGADGPRASIWTSEDGRTWHGIDRDEAGLGRGVVSDVAATGDRLIAIGTLDDAAATHDGAVWSSSDGRAWSRIAAGEPSFTGPDETELSRITSFAGGLFVVGNHGSHQERVQCEQLLGAMASIQEPPPSETALSCGWGREHHWLSVDGASWDRLPPLDPLPGQLPAPGLRPLEFRLVAPGGPGLVNLAEDNRPPDGDTGVWVSADGASWRSVEGGAVPMPAGFPTGVALLGRRMVAVGEIADPAPGVGIWIGEVR
jgi:hypothetical protein